MSEEFETGAVVVLKSGSPKMTVTGKSTLGEAMCTWFDGVTQHSGNFPREALTLWVKPERPSVYRSGGSWMSS
jgi:uncharacterized protein YodC (DUF2158 family)